MAQDLGAKKLNFVSRSVQATQDLLKAYAALRQLRQEWTSEGYSGTIVQADLDGTVNKHLTPTILGSLWNTFDTVDRLVTAPTAGSETRDAGHLTNLYNVQI